METGRSTVPDEEVLRCADVLGAFGVSPADVRAIDRPGGSRPRAAATEESLEAVLADLLADSRDRTAFFRQTICRSDRGLTCSARYAHGALERELAAVFESVDWSFDLAESRRGLELAAADPAGRRRETTLAYPETPLGSDNLPAVLHAITADLLAGTDARFVLLSAGVDRWRAALIDDSELDRLRERYGDRVDAFDRPLLPEHDLAAYVPDADDDPALSESAAEARGERAEPWPAWAREREDRRSGGRDDGPSDDEPADRDDGIPSLIEEAEPESDGAAAETSEIDGFELGGSSTVSRVSGTASEAAGDRSAAGGDRGRETRVAGQDDVSTDGSRETSTDGWSLSGPTTTTRVSNDSFGTGDEPQSADDRYRALGAALGTGRDVTVKGLLEDDDFLPELPAAEPEETRLTFENAFDPAAVSEAKAAAEQSGFVWVDAGSMETTRVSNG